MRIGVCNVSHSDVHFASSDSSESQESRRIYDVDKFFGSINLFASKFSLSAKCGYNGTDGSSVVSDRD